MNRDELKQYLPHREPMLLIDEVVIDDAGIAHARYRIREDEFFCRGHFPGNPIVPGVIQCEMMAQSCAILVLEDLKGKTTLYTGMENIRFKNLIRPGDLCEITARLDDVRGNIYFCSAVVKVDGRICCKGSLSFALVD